MSGEEQQLIQEVAAGSRTAFEKLFKAYHPRVYKFCIRIVKDPQLADEATNDTLFVVWDSAGKFLGNSSVSTWILGIAYNRSLKLYNKNARHTRQREPESNFDELTDNDPGINPEVHTAQRIEGKLVQDAIDRLSTDHKAILELVAMGHSCAEIAAIVQCPENTVKTRTFHARRKLNTYLGALNR